MKKIFDKIKFNFFCLLFLIINSFTITFASETDKGVDKKIKKIRVVVVSDTHMQHEKIKLPEGDIFIHAGDFTNYGRGDFVSFNNWLAGGVFKKKVVVSGNHEVSLGSERLKRDIQGAEFLSREPFDFEGLKFFAMGWPKDGNFSWPKGVDILITHEAPATILGGPDRDCRAVDLIKEIHQKALDDDLPIIHFFGHHHSCRGVEERQHPQTKQTTLFVNASCEFKKNSTTPAMVFELILDTDENKKGRDKLLKIEDVTDPSNPKIFFSNFKDK